MIGTKKPHFAFVKESIARRFQRSDKKTKKAPMSNFSKRRVFVIAVLVLSIVLFVSQYQFGRSGIYVAVILAVLTDIFLYFAVKDDIKGNFSWKIFILPTLYSLSFGLFYFLIPARLLARGVLTILFAFGLYSLYLSQNIFIIGSVRTIALLSGARIVSFVIALISFFFLTNIALTLHLFILPLLLIMAVYTYPLIYHCLWTYNLQKTATGIPVWVGLLTVCLLEVMAGLWFWPSSPTVSALFLTGFFYTLVGLSHVWLERRLFRGVLWEYVWVGVVVFFVLMLFTPWGR
jgi:hypothetical protein